MVLEYKGGIQVLVSTIHNGNNKIRSPTHAVTDWIYCPEAPGSPRPQAVNPVSYCMEGTS